MHTLMNACLHLAPHEGTAHDLTHVTHDKRPHLQARHACRPHHALTCEFYKVVLSRESRGNQISPTPNPHATHTCPKHAQSPFPRFLLLLLRSDRRYKPASKSESLHGWIAGWFAADGWQRLPLLQMLLGCACRRLDAAAAELAAALGAPACAMKLRAAAPPRGQRFAERSLNIAVLCGESGVRGRGSVVPSHIR